MIIPNYLIVSQWSFLPFINYDTSSCFIIEYIMFTRLNLASNLNGDATLF